MTTAELEALADDAAKAWTAFVSAREAMNAARPSIAAATKAEHALYDERCRADYDAEREHFRTAIKLAQASPAILAALKTQQPGEDVVERVARALCAADPEVRHGDAEGVVQQRVHIEWHQYAHAARAAIAAMQESRDD